ncbi:SsrA-binding protein SmpB [bacterium]|nr:SsrA-binding protein SmpB [bacterium]
MKVITTNRKASHFYEIEDNIEAGIALTGSEIKSVREGKVDISDSFAKIEKGEIWLMNMYIAPYDKARGLNVDPRRPRKLLLKKREIRHLMGKVLQRGYTLIPLRVYIKGRWAKVELGLAKGKKLYDRRREIAERDMRREMERMLKGGD